MNRTVCIPVLSILNLLYFRFLHLQGSYTIYYEILPRWFRGLSRVFPLTGSIYIKYLELITGCCIQPIKHGDNVKDYPNIRMDAYIQMVEIGEKLTNHFINDVWRQPLKSILGEEPSIAAAIKFFAHYQLRLYFFPVVLCYKTIINKDDKRLFVVCPVFWTKELQDIIKNDFGFSRIEFIHLPWIFNLINKLTINIKVIRLWIYN